jgi:hypothetical protein
VLNLDLTIAVTQVSPVGSHSCLASRMAPRWRARAQRTCNQLDCHCFIAYTQNYVSSANFERVWKHTRKGRPKMSVRWLERLRIARPDLAAVADDILEKGEVRDWGCCLLLEKAQAKNLGHF